LIHFKVIMCYKNKEGLIHLQLDDRHKGLIIVYVKLQFVAFDNSVSLITANLTMSVTLDLVNPVFFKNMLIQQHIDNVSCVIILQ